MPLPGSRRARSFAAAKIPRADLQRFHGPAPTKVPERLSALAGAACLTVAGFRAGKIFAEFFCSCGAKVSRRVPCSLTAEAGGIKPGCLGPSAKLPRRFSSATSPSKKVLTPHVPFLISIFYLPFSKRGRSFPAASLASARKRPLNSPALKRPSRQSQRRKSSARCSPFCELHSAHEDTRLR